MSKANFAKIEADSLFYCKDAGESFLTEESIDLFIGHPPYYMAELERNGGDPAKQMQNAETLDEYYERLLKSFVHMEQALKPNGHMFIALDNSSVGLGMLPLVASRTELVLQTIRIWNYPTDEKDQSSSVVFAQYSKKQDYSDTYFQGPFILTNPWEEAYEELEKYNQDYATVGAAPTGIYFEMIENFSKEGDVVCDLFAGCGTVPLVAMTLGRKFIFNDVSEDKYIMAKQRIKDALAE